MGVSDTDILVILVGTIGQQNGQSRTMANIVVDCGVEKSRRYIKFINITCITAILEECKSGLARALLGYHAFTGCKSTSAFYKYT